MRTWLMAAALLAACSGSPEKADDTPTETPTGGDGGGDIATTEDAPPPEEEAARPAPAALDLDAVEDLDTLFTVDGGVDREQISGVIGQRKPDVYQCYSDALAANPGMAGRVYIQITTTPDGGVAAALVKQSTLNKPAVEQCMVKRIRDWKFPHGADGGLVIIKYAFQLPP